MARGPGSQIRRQNGPVRGKIFQACRKTRLAGSAGAAGQVGVTGIQNVPKNVGPIGFRNAIVVQEVNNVTAGFRQSTIPGVPVAAPRFWNVSRREG